MLNWVCFYIVIMFLSVSLTWIFRYYALKISLIDIPNHRSSHRTPTPKGGGLSFVVCFILVVFFLYFTQKISESMLITLAGLGALIALLSFLDDNYSISANWRLLGHFLLSSAGLYFIGGFPEISFSFGTLSSGWVLNILGAFYLVWLLNLYNFMDGIDGIAALESVTVCLSSALLYYLHGEDSAMLLSLGLAVSVSGFLYWNFPPARIFMGDVGSSFLGFILGLLSIYGTLLHPDFFWSWLILLGVFIVDATLTLLNRFIQKEKLFEPHCTHAYQHASRYYKQHRAVTLRVGGINLFWLLPWALLVGNGIISGLPGLCLAYIPLVYFAYYFKAGCKINS